MSDIVVIGAGLFGNVIAAALSEDGHDVIVVDDAKLIRGSYPAACLMKPSWLGSMDKKDQAAALVLLDRIYGVHNLEFKLPLGAAATVHWVDPHQILQSPNVKGTVRGFRRYSGAERWEVYVHGGSQSHILRADKVISAAGIWTDAMLREAAQTGTQQLAPWPVVQGQAGVAFLFPHARIDAPFIRPWAPYKQLVAFNRGDGLWVGDGSAIKQENWTAERTQACFHRCLNALGEHVSARDMADVEILYGVRPYVAGPEGKPAYLKEVFKDFWVATGGAKNGTAGAAWCANQLVEKLA